MEVAILAQKKKDTHTAIEESQNYKVGFFATTYKIMQTGNQRCVSENKHPKHVLSTGVDKNTIEA